MTTPYAHSKVEAERLVERFARNLDAYRRADYKEAQVRVEFIAPLFEALGWDVRRLRLSATPPPRRQARLTCIVYLIFDQYHERCDDVCSVDIGCYHHPRPQDALPAADRGHRPAD
jgi:hypothetical protein